MIRDPGWNFIAEFYVVLRASEFYAMFPHCDSSGGIFASPLLSSVPQLCGLCSYL
jgi:hypothetical protein